MHHWLENWTKLITSYMTVSPKIISNIIIFLNQLFGYHANSEDPDQQVSSASFQRSSIKISRMTSKVEHDLYLMMLYPYVNFEWNWCILSNVIDWEPKVWRRLTLPLLVIPSLFSRHFVICPLAQSAASDQILHCLLTYCTIKIWMNWKLTSYQTTLKLEIDLFNW